MGTSVTIHISEGGGEFTSALGATGHAAAGEAPQPLSLELLGRPGAAGAPQGTAGDRPPPATPGDAPSPMPIDALAGPPAPAPARLDPLSAPGASSPAPLLLSELGAPQAAEPRPPSSQGNDAPAET